MRLLAIDMDDTCLNKKNRISPSTMEALRQAAKAGMEIVPATGWVLSCLPHQLKEADFYRYVISSNGARITDRKEGENLHRAFIPPQTAIQFLQACQRRSNPQRSSKEYHDSPGKIRGIGIAVHIGDEYVVQGRVLAALGRPVYGKDAANTRQVKDMVSYIETGINTPAKTKGGKRIEEIGEIQLYFASSKVRQQMKEILHHFPQLAAAYTPRYVEIFSPRATKGNALAALRRYLGIPKEEVVCIGDGENDLTMFREAGLKFAMGNAVSGLKEQADHILPSNTQDGVAEAIFNTDSIVFT